MNTVRLRVWLGDTRINSALRAIGDNATQPWLGAFVPQDFILETTEPVPDLADKLKAVLVQQGFDVWKVEEISASAEALTPTTPPPADAGGAQPKDTCEG